MKIPNPYFENVPNYGNLSVEEVFYEDGYLILFILKSKDGQRFLAYCCEVRNEQRWILSQVSNQTIINLIYNKETIFTAIINSENHIVAVRNYTTRTDSFQTVSTPNLDPLDLPEKDEFLDVDCVEYSSYLETLNYSCYKISDLSWTYVLTVVPTFTKEIPHFAFPQFKKAKKLWLEVSLS